VAFEKTAVYFDAARHIRNDFSYDSPVYISDTDADDLIQSVEHFERDVEVWIGRSMLRWLDRGTALPVQWETFINDERIALRAIGETMRVT
jgi:hypothetical protein